MTSKRKRIVVSKPSKNACKTCRIRRIKCDEERPGCQRCSSTGRICDGYFGTSPPRNDAASKRALLPSNGTHLLNGTQPSNGNQPHAGFSITLRYAHGSALATDIERNAFAFFVQETAAPLERIFGPQEWLRLTLQIGADLPVVFNAIAAVGCMAHARVQINIADHTLTELKTNMNEDLPLQQYCKATQSLQRYIDESVMHGTSIEPVLICSLLFVLFEIFRGETALALSHLQHGRRALQAAKTPSPSPRSSVSSSDSQTAITGLMSTFNWLGKESIAADPCMMIGQTSSQRESLAINRLLPTKLESLGHAKHSLDCLAAETSHWRNELVSVAEEHLASIELPSLSVAERYCVAHCLSRSVDTRRHPGLLRRRDHLIAGQERWLSMLTALETNAADPILMLMQLQHFYSYFLMTTSRDTTEKPLDHFDFKSILELADRYLHRYYCSEVLPSRPPDSEPLRSFSLEAGPLSVLFLICLKCRNEDLRSRALSLLRHANRREGLQYSNQLCVYAECIVQFERERAKAFFHLEDHRPLNYWFERAPEAARYPSMVIQGIGYHEIRVIGCRYADKRASSIETMVLKGAGMPPLRLEEMNQVTIPITSRG